MTLQNNSVRWPFFVVTFGVIRTVGFVNSAIKFARKLTLELQMILMFVSHGVISFLVQQR